MPETRESEARPGRGLTALAAFVCYGLLSFLYFGLPLVGHFGSYAVGNGTDPYIFTWSFAWWSHALVEGLNPVYTHVVWAPGGFDLAWATTTPSLSLAFAPLTLAAGPVVSFNVASVLMPALAAWTAFLLCRRLSQRVWPSLAGGYLFGFSSYMLGQEQGHLHLTPVFVLPLVVLVLLRYLDGELAGRGLVVRLGPLLAFAFGVSTELAFTLTLALGTGLLLAFAIVPGRRARLAALVRPLGAAYLLAGVLVSPLLYYTLSGFESGAVNAPDLYPGDLLNLVVPTGLAEFSGHWANDLAKRFLGNSAEEDLYLGVPLLIIVGWFLLRERRQAATRFLGACFAVVVIASLGPGLYLAGRKEAPAPWALVHHLPLFNNVIAPRLATYTALLAAVIVSLWAASSRASPTLRAVLVAAAVVSQLPNAFVQTPWRLKPDIPRFFAAGGAYATCLRAGDNLLVLPFLTDSLLWQPANDYRYTLAVPDLTSQLPPRLRHNRIVGHLVANSAPPGGGAALLRFARADRVTAIAVEAARADPWRRLLSPLIRPTRREGVLLYRLTPPPAGCR